MREFLYKYKNQLVLTLILLILGISTYFVYQVSKDIITHSVSVILVERGDLEYELKIRKSDNATIYREGDTETVLSKIPRLGKERLSLPDMSKIKAEDTLKGRLAINDLTWDLTFSDSFKYIKYLIETDGYEIEMYASTPQFIELFLVKDNAYKRFIVFREMLMMGDMFDNSELPDIKTYFENYSNLEGESSYE